jgi:hypothetical protein
MRVVRWVLGILAVGFVIWVLGGVVRADGAARDWFAGAHGSGATVSNVDVEGLAPAIPPFWQLTISGDVTEAGQTTPAYRSTMHVFIEPWTGIGWSDVQG